MVVESLVAESLGQPWIIALIVVVTLLGLVALLVAVKCVCYTRNGGGMGGRGAAGRNGSKSGVGSGMYIFVIMFLKI